MKNRSELASWIGLKEKILLFLLYKLPPEKKYKEFTIKKRNGGHRQISAPLEALKFAQKQISLAIQEISPPRHIAKGYVRGKDISHHARAHTRKRSVIVADLKSFFPSINFGRVRGLFLAPPFSFPEEVATLIAQLTCKGNEIPQGSPSSPAISNAVCRKLDRQLLELAKLHRASISRYADDICISFNKKSVSHKIVEILPFKGYVAGEEFRRIVSSNGFELNDAKFHLLTQSEQQMVTGLVVNRGLSIPRKWRRQLRTILHLRSKFEVDKATEIVNSWKSPSASRREKVGSADKLISGKSSFAKFVDLASEGRFINSLHRAYPKCGHLLPRTKPEFPVRIMSEGPTDLLHLRAALHRFGHEFELSSIHIKLLNYHGDTGDVDVLATLRRIAKVDVDELTIGLFDCDNPKLMKEIALDPGAYVRLGRMVYAASLAPPTAETAPPYCIESLYPREQCTRVTPQGRRLFFGDEFSSDGKQLNGGLVREYPKKSAVALSERVFDPADPTVSLTLSKVDFANMVNVGASPFDNIDFSGFLPTLRLIRDMIDEAIRYKHARIIP